MKSGVFSAFGFGVFLIVGFAVNPVQASVEEGFEGLNGGFAVVGSEQVRAMKSFPEVEAVTQVPSFFKPSEQAEIFLFCESEVGNNDRAVQQAKGTFLVELYLLDHKTGKFETFVVGSGKTKGDSDGYGAFSVSVPMAPFASRLQSGSVSAWFRTHGKFVSKKGDYAALGCFASTSAW